MGVTGAVEVQPFPAEKTPYVSMAQGLLDEAVKGNPMTTVIPGVDESKSSPRTTEGSTEPKHQLQKEAEGALSHVACCHGARD